MYTYVMTGERCKETQSEAGDGTGGSKKLCSVWLYGWGPL